MLSFIKVIIHDRLYSPYSNYTTKFQALKRSQVPCIPESNYILPTNHMPLEKIIQVDCLYLFE